MAAATTDKASKGHLQTSNNGQKWSDLFKANSKPSGSFKLRKWNENEREISKDELRNLGFCLVGYILGRFPGVQAIDQLRKSWKVDSIFSIHDSGWLIFSFKNEDDRDSVLHNGPYETMGTPWVLKKLPQYFRFDDECFSLIPSWVRLPGLPLDFWTVNALGKIASSIGEPLAADECTALMTKTSFARLLVEVDVTKPLVKEVSFCMPNGSVFVQEVNYEREPRFCCHCRRIGHLELECKRKPRRNPADNVIHEQRDQQLNPSGNELQAPPVADQGAKAGLQVVGKKQGSHSGHQPKGISEDDVVVLHTTPSAKGKTIEPQLTMGETSQSSKKVTQGQCSSALPPAQGIQQTAELQTSLQHGPHGSTSEVIQK